MKSFSLCVVDFSAAASATPTGNNTLSNSSKMLKVTADMLSHCYRIAGLPATALISKRKILDAIASSFHYRSAEKLQASVILLLVGEAAERPAF